MQRIGNVHYRWATRHKDGWMLYDARRGLLETQMTKHQALNFVSGKRYK